MIDPNNYTIQHVELEVENSDIEEGLKDVILTTLDRYTKDKKAIKQVQNAYDILDEENKKIKLSLLIAESKLAKWSKEIERLVTLNDRLRANESNLINKLTEQRTQVIEPAAQRNNAEVNDESTLIDEAAAFKEELEWRESEEYKEMEAKLDAPKQRTTEQDAREIAKEALLAIYLLPLSEERFSEWLDNGGRTLLDKLNEHREPVQDGHYKRKLYALLDGLEFKNTPKAIEAMDSVDFLIVGEEIAAKAKQVSTNKAEVPLIEIIESAHMAGQIYAGIDPSYSQAKVYAQSQSLPPLKDDTKMKCKGTNCSAVNSNIHSLECRAEHDALVYSGAGNRHPEARYRGYKGEPLKPNSSADEHAAWMEGDAARIRPLKDDEK